MQKEWRIAPENDDLLLKHGRLFCNWRYICGGRFCLADIRMFVLYRSVSDTQKIKTLQWKMKILPLTNDDFDDFVTASSRVLTVSRYV